MHTSFQFQRRSNERFRELFGIPLVDYLVSSIQLVLADSGAPVIVLIVLLALFTRAAIGFGDGIIAVPLLAFVIEINEAVPFMLLLSTTMSCVALWKERAHIQFSSLKRTAGMALLGFPFGIALLGVVDNERVKGILGGVLIILALWYFFGRGNVRIYSRAWSYLFGLAAGVLGGAFSFRGIVFSIYGNLRGWTPAEFKSTIHSFYILSGLLIPFGFYSAGLLTPRVIGLYLVMLPVALVATLIGAWSSSRLDKKTFQNISWSVLLLLGVFLLFN